MPERTNVNPEAVINKLSARMAELIKQNVILETALSEAQDENQSLHAQLNRKVEAVEDPPLVSAQ